MISFKKIGLEDRDLINPYLLNRDSRDCDLSFVNLFTWQFLTESAYAIVDDCLLLRFTLPGNRQVYLKPEGRGDARKVVSMLIEQARTEQHILRIHGFFPDLSDWLDREFPESFVYRKDRDYFDYIYLRQELAELKGKDFQAKRNHVNKFKKTYAYSYEPLTPALIPQCLKLEEKWCARHGCADSESLEYERKALTLALKHFEALELQGGVILVDGQIAAFTYGAPLNRDTFGIHIEKADTEIEGAYNIINQEFVRRIPEQYAYINREEDLGLPGLRKAKLSYRPVILLEKGYARLKPSV